MASNEGGASQENFVVRLFDFERLIGADLIKIVYYLGLVGIGFWALLALSGVLNASRYMNSGATLVALGAAIFGFALWVVFWRFICELWMVAFRIYDRLGEIRDRLPPSA